MIASDMLQVAIMFPASTGLAGNNVTADNIGTSVGSDLRKLKLC